MSVSQLATPRSLRNPRALLVWMHVPFIAFTAGRAVTGLAIGPNEWRWGLLPLVLVAGALQIRHSLAFAEGRQPPYAAWSLLVLVLIAYVPYPWLGNPWGTTHWYVIASLAMCLPARVAPLAAAADALVIDAWETLRLAASTNESAMQLGWEFTYLLTVLSVGGFSLYAASRLVWHVEALRDTRADLADLAIGRERLRISRDLHDLLGQSLSAVSLKGDLAIGLLQRRELAQAAAEIESLVHVARSAMHDLRDIAHHEPAISLAREMERAADLLAAVGIETRINTSNANVAAPIDELFAWALREGVTNVLRHSVATSCTIGIERRNGAVCLEIANDGAPSTFSSGHGLSGLATRAAALDGAARSRSTGGRFVLTVEVPERKT